jgi:hypothetical protein
MGLKYQSYNKSRYKLDLLGSWDYEVDGEKKKVDFERKQEIYDIMTQLILII